MPAWKVSPERKPWLGHDCATTMYVHEESMSTAIASTEPDTNVSLGRLRSAA